MFHGEQCNSCREIFMICQQWVAVISSSSHFVLSYRIVISVLCHGAVYFRAVCIFVCCEIEIYKKVLVKTLT
jgi:hypothetical protein